jgi:hypothetical protein
MRTITLLLLTLFLTSHAMAGGGLEDVASMIKIAKKLEAKEYLTSIARMKRQQRLTRMASRSARPIVIVNIQPSYHYYGMLAADNAARQATYYLNGGR